MKKIYVLAFPRSGLHWLSWMLSDVLDCPVEFLNQRENTDRQTDKYLVIGCHQLPTTFNRGSDLVVYLVRNPRSIALSFFHFFRKVTSIVQALNKVNLPWKKHVVEGVKIANTIVSYEHLSMRSQTVLKTVLDDIGIEVEPERIKKAILNHTVDQDRQRLLYLYGKDSPHNKLVRAGKMSEWTKAFSIKEREKAQRLFGMYDPYDVRSMAERIRKELKL